MFGKPAVMPGFYGSHLGVIDLDLIWDEGRWQVKSGQGTLRPICRRTAKGRLRPLVANASAIVQASSLAHRATRAWANRPVGHTACALHSYFAMVAPSAVQRLVARAQAAHVARALRDGPYADLPVLSAAAPFHAGGRGGPDNYVDIPPGPLKLRHIYDLYPHPNVTAALRVTGADLYLWLERSFSQFRQIAPCSQDAPLLDDDFPSFNFDTVDGLTWAVDLAAPPWVDARGTVLGTQPPRRIRDLSFQGKPLDPDQPFVLATNSYRASGSGGFVSDQVTALRLDPECSSRDALAAFVAENERLIDLVPPNWHFLPMPGTSVSFDSAPSAECHLASLARHRVHALCMTPQGFRRFRLHL
jgi:2',3'-cyclic-nucleotide 2'-phosphodiesterase/3'-nucleotidase